MLLDSLWPWRGAALALLVALAWAGLLRALRRPDLASLGAGIGLAAGWVMILGLPAASPRQLPERLPLLAAGGAGMALLLSLLAGGRRGPAAAGAALALLAAAWWLAGAPRDAADTWRAAVPLLGLLLALLAAQLRLDGPWPAAFAFALLLGGFWIGAPRGPWLVLAAAALAAVLGAALPADRAWGVGARMPVAAALAGLAAGPVLARGSAADWLAAASPFAALWLGPALAVHLGGGWAWALGWLLAGGIPLLFTWVLARGL